MGVLLKMFWPDAIKRKEMGRFFYIEFDSNQSEDIPMTTVLRASGLATLALIIIACGSSVGAQTHPEDDVSAVLDSLHSKASQADFAGYFDLYADDAIFLGTDATERWNVTDFKAYTKPHFDRGNGWTYTPIQRHIYISEDGSTAWFDESLDNASLGLTRGSGALIKSGESWKVVQYNLTIPIPNELAREVVDKIRSLEQ